MQKGYSAKTYASECLSHRFLAASVHVDTALVPVYCRISQYRQGRPTLELAYVLST